MVLKETFIQDEDFEDFKSQYNNCYVYELFVKATGEIYYVGYDSDEERDEPMDNYSIHKGERDLLSRYLETEERILKTGLREAWAAYYVEKRIKEIASTNMLYNSQNHSCFSRITFCEGVTPKLEVSPIEQHYLGMEPISFDTVSFSNLKVVYLDTGFMSTEILTYLYGRRYEEYYNQLKIKLEAIGTKIIVTPYAKSVTAWIQLGGGARRDYEKTQERAVKKIGRNIPVYHIFDVLAALKNITVSNPINSEALNVEIHPIHNRCPWQNIKNLNDFSAGFRDGYHFWEAGEKLRLQGDIEEAILLFDKARENGYDAPALYESYEKAYRKNKDYENEIAILMERYERNQAIHGNDRAWDRFFVELKEKIELAKKRLLQFRNKN